MTDFAIGEAAWIDRLGNLRNAVRQELIDAEERAGQLDPYRSLGSQIHVIARR